MTKKPFKVLSATAMVAALSTSALVPSAVFAAEDTVVLEISHYVVEVEGKLVALLEQDFTDLKAAEKVTGSDVKYVQAGNNFYLLEDFVDAKAAIGNNPTQDEVLELLAEEGLEADVEVFESVIDEEGNVTPGDPIVNPDPTPELSVELVSAINNNGVTVAFSALTGDIDSATVTVKDPAGNEVAVVAQNLSKGATSATFPFTAPQTGLAAGTWTVDGKEILVKSQEAGLSNLVTNVGVWSEDFAKDKLENGVAGAAAYKVFVQNGVSSIELTPTAAEGATITAEVTRGSAQPATQVLSNNTANTINLAAATTGSSVTSVIITVVAPDQKTSKKYSLDITRAATAASNDAYPTGITATGITFDATFSATKNNYVANVANSVTTATFVPVKKAGQTVFINGVESTDPVTLKVGKNTVEVKVVAADNSTSKTYNYEIVRANPNGSPAKTLNSLTLSTGTLNGLTVDDVAGAAGLTTAVPNSVKDLTITPVATNAGASVSVSAANVSLTPSDLVVEKSGSSYTIKGLQANATNVVTITVTPENGAAPQVYILTVTRAAATASDVANLSALTVGTLFPTPTTFKATTTDYSFNVANTVASVGTITATPAVGASVSYEVNGVAYATALLAGAADLKIGANVVKIKVTSADTLNSRTYTVTINKADAGASTVNTLNTLTLSAGTLTGFTADAAPAALATSVANSVSDLTITPTTTNEKAQVAVTAVGPAPGAANLSVEKSGTGYVVKGLQAGANVVTITVTPESAGAAATYTLTVNKAGVSANDNANLASAVIGATLTFGTNQTSASTNVPYATSSVALGTLTAVDSTNATAVWKKNGQVVTGNQSLAVGANKFEVEVTAGNGNTTKTYTVTVVRAAETASNQAGLSSLTVDKGTFISGTKVESDVTAITTETADLHVGSASEFNSVTFTATPADAAALVEVLAGTGVAVGDITKNANGTFTVASLADGDIVDVKVTSPADATITYTTTVTVRRAAAGASPFATLTGLTEAFTDGTSATEVANTAADVTVKPATKSYEYFVTNDTVDVAFTKNGSDTSKTVSYVLNGETYTDSDKLPLSVGANVVTVNVLAADKVTKETYTLTINRASSAIATDATSTLKDNADVTIADASTISGIAANAAYTFSVNPTDANATVKVSAAETVTPANAVQVALVNGKYVVDGQPASSSTTVTVTVVAADKATKKVETFIITTP